ncbi:hypothetical protein, partial [Pseudoalteromonas sp. GABNS16H]|uniref:hypothetical protein n=1 Tax=Pseudoalteromonas sp. GABNS16H TaxID=3025325 RepID=UPI00235DDA77
MSYSDAELLEDFRAVGAAILAKSTLGVLRADSETFLNLCRARPFQPIPASFSTIPGFIRYRASQGVKFTIIS